MVFMHQVTIRNIFLAPLEAGLDLITNVPYSRRLQSLSGQTENQARGSQ